MQLNSNIMYFPSKMEMATCSPSKMETAKGISRPGAQSVLGRRINQIIGFEWKSSLLTKAALLLQRRTLHLNSQTLLHNWSGRVRE